ncbi:MAG: sigma-70 family RNA polymerase sigma factor [Chloroflexi bacterium]|nr:MAG: sigma-70 family RNA polymerase sigma factor [Chloroflexota bacterium]
MPQVDGSREHIAQQLLAKGKRQGYLTIDDILDAFPEAEEDLARLEDLYVRLLDAGIEIQANGEMPEREAEAEVDLSHEEFLDSIEIDDTISLYLKEVSRIPLLTAEDEIELAKTMRRGERAQRKLDRASADPANNQLSAMELAKLEQQVQAGEEARKKLTRANSRLVISMAKRYVGQGVPFLDLIQEGNMGLMKAVEKFDHRRGHKFSTYATWWIRQSITRAIADQGRTIRVPVHMNDRIRRLYRVSRRLEQELGREPSVEELAEEMGLAPEKVERIIEISQRPLSLEKPVGEEKDSELGEFIEAQDVPDPDDEATLELLREDIEELLTSLTPREARVLELRYGLIDGHSYTLKEVGEKFGLTRERIRQIENEALQRLRHPQRSRKLRDYLN